MTAIEIIRVIGTEFADVDDATLELWVEIVSPMVSKKQFGKLYQQAIAYLICHKLTLAGYGSSDSSGSSSGSLGVAARTDTSIASISAGSYSISYGSSSTSDLTSTDAELGLTTYGVQYLQLRRSVIVPIHISGQRA